MITIEQERCIEELLSSENSKDIVRYMVEEYSKYSADSCKFLLNLIPNIAKLAIHIIEKERMAKSQAIFMMMYERIADIKGNESTYFASMVPVCITHFPEGNARGRSEAEKNYFKLFCELLKNKKAFSWKKDRDWGDTYKYTDYLRLVESQMERGDNK